MTPEQEKKAFEAFKRLLVLQARATGKSVMEIVEEMHYRRLEREEQALEQAKQTHNDPPNP
jgi:hypothetical protein